MIRMTSRMLALTIALTIAVSCNPPRPNPGPITEENGLIRLRTTKNRAEDRVRRAKRFSDASKQEQARRLYDDTIDQYNAYVDGLLHCVRTGKSADLTPSATEASTRAAAFTQFVDDNSPTKGVDWVTTAANLVKAALEIFKIVEKAGEVERKQYADELEPQIKWKTWNDIK